MIPTLGYIGNLYSYLQYVLLSAAVSCVCRRSARPHTSLLAALMGSLRELDSRAESDSSREVPLWLLSEQPSPVQLDFFVSFCFAFFTYLMQQAILFALVADNRSVQKDRFLLLFLLCFVCFIVVSKLFVFTFVVGFILKYML